MNDGGWIGVDLDGTLAHYDGWKGIDHIGEPIPAMMERVRAWLDEGREVRIFTARVCEPRMGGDGDGSAQAAREHILRWLWEHDLIVDGEPLAVTNIKDFAMLELWDDRAVQVEINTGLAYVHPHSKETTP